jgi:hypothetical protein
MIDVDCPNCGYHLGSLDVKPLEAGSVKENTYPQGLEGKGSPGPVSVMQLSERILKTEGSVEASVAKQPWREAVTKADVKDIKRLYPRATQWRESGIRSGSTLRSLTSWE